MIYLVIARKGTEQVRFERKSVEAAFQTAKALRTLGWLVLVSKPLKGTGRAA